MTKSQAAASPGWVWGLAATYSLLILAAGLWVSVATGEWIALVCVSGLILLPLGGLARRRSRTR
ncbi:MAG: hypothetical protein ACOH14_04775 [Rhodoglobus sp.]